MAAPHTTLPLPLLLVLVGALLAAAPLPSAAGTDAFDVRRHLSTVTRYDVARGSSNAISSPSISDGCHIIHLNLVARHGTRAPTKKRIKELDRLALRLEALMNEAKQSLDSDSLKKIPSWIKGWESRWKGRTKGGELIREGEEELYNLGIRVKEKFQDLFDEEYHPDVYSIRATQVSADIAFPMHFPCAFLHLYILQLSTFILFSHKVPRASASAVAFGLGLLSEKGKLGPGKNRAFSVLSESRASDICLRFFDSCETYKAYRKRKEPEVDKQKEPILEHVTASLVSRYHLNFTTQDVSSLWFLCKQEASLLNITNQACGMFNEAEVYFLEWTDDLEGFVLKGYGESINYRMGLPLLKDVVQSIEEAIVAKEENHPDGTYEKARLRFAHAETVVPFSCLLGLFLEGSGCLIRHLSSVGLCMQGCGNKDFCPFEEFKEKIVKPHLKHDYNMICKIKPPVAKGEPASFSSMVSKFFVGLFSGYRVVSAEDIQSEL
ncbi:hypothetical protein PR202_ga13954 [Eleusine coracana subsp. coracana]|uniref:Multiple inositol polyphosphate phosphatase 1 n=1 Tax=Eleusine coracana subsp. coracana TaxID=191504 RepID=A0AAV5CG96_ELECO|nr:hypothetical protein PR202_ga13954 [Eleusine coracana subsp. coracana]